MTVTIITGGGGFLGQCLASSLLSETDVGKVILADVAFPPSHELQPQIVQGIAQGRVECKSGSVAKKEFCNSVLSSSEKDVSVYHLGAVMSGTGEADFDLCMQVNLFGTMNMLEAARAHPSRVKFVYASAGATIGSGSPQDWIQKEDGEKMIHNMCFGLLKHCQIVRSLFMDDNPFLYF